MAKNKDTKAQENMDADQLNGDEAENFNFSNEVPEGWGDEEIMTNFPPYWAAEVGTAVVANVVGYDDSDPEFPRYILRAIRPFKGFRGGKDSKTPVAVKAGEVFTCSVWSALDLKKLIGLDVYIKVLPDIKANTPAGFVRAFQCIPSKEAMGVLKARSQRVVEGELMAAKSA